MRINKAVKIIMAEQGVSAFEISKRTGLTRQAIYAKLRAGGDPRINGLEDIAKALNVKLSYLIEKAEKLEAKLAATKRQLKQN